MNFVDSDTTMDLSSLVDSLATVRTKTGPSRMRLTGTATISRTTVPGTLCFSWRPETPDSADNERFSVSGVFINPADVDRVVAKGSDADAAAKIRRELELPSSGIITTDTLPFMRFQPPAPQYSDAGEDASRSELASKGLSISRALNSDGTFGALTEITGTVANPIHGAPPITHTYPLQHSGWKTYDVDPTMIVGGKLRVDGRTLTDNRFHVRFDKSVRAPDGGPVAGATICPNTLMEMWFDHDEIDTV